MGELVLVLLHRTVPLLEVLEILFHLLLGAVGKVGGEQKSLKFLPGRWRQGGVGPPRALGLSPSVCHLVQKGHCELDFISLRYPEILEQLLYRINP